MAGVPAVAVWCRWPVFGLVPTLPAMFVSSFGCWLSEPRQSAGELRAAAFSAGVVLRDVSDDDAAAAAVAADLWAAACGCGSLSGSGRSHAERLVLARVLFRAAGRPADPPSGEPAAGRLPSGVSSRFGLLEGWVASFGWASSRVAGLWRAVSDDLLSPVSGLECVSAAALLRAATPQLA